MPETTDEDRIPEEGTHEPVEDGTSDTSPPNPEGEGETEQATTEDVDVQRAGGQANDANIEGYVNGGVSALLQKLRGQLGCIAGQAGIEDIGAPDTAREAQALQTDLDAERRVRQGIWAPVEGILRAAEQKIRATKTIKTIDAKLACCNTHLAQKTTILGEIENTLRELQNTRDANAQEMGTLEQERSALLTRIASETEKHETAQRERDELARNINQMDIALGAAVNEFLNGLTVLGIDAPVLRKLLEYATALLQGTSQSPADGQSETAGEDLKNVLQSQLASVVFEAVHDLVGRIGTEKSTKDGRLANLDGFIAALAGTITTLNQHATALQTRIKEIGGATQQAEQTAEEGRGKVTKDIATIDGQKTQLQNERGERASAEHLRDTATTLHGLVGYHLTEEQTKELRYSIQECNAAGIVTLLQTAKLTEKGNKVRLYIKSTPITLSANEVTNEIVANALRAFDEKKGAVVGHAEAFNGLSMLAHIKNNAKKGGKVVGEYSDGTSFAITITEDWKAPRVLKTKSVYRLAYVPPVKAE